MLWKCCTHLPANLENTAVTTGLEKVSFHSYPKERQCQRMLKLLHNALVSHAIKVMLKILQVRLQYCMNCEIPDVQTGFINGIGTGGKHLLDYWKSKGVPEKHLFLLYWLCQSLWLCGSQQTGKFSKRWEYQTTCLPPEKPVYRSGSNS